MRHCWVKSWAPFPVLNSVESILSAAWVIVESNLSASRNIVESNLSAEWDIVESKAEPCSVQCWVKSMCCMGHCWVKSWALFGGTLSSQSKGKHVFFTLGKYFIDQCSYILNIQFSMSFVEVHWKNSWSSIDHRNTVN